MAGGRPTIYTPELAERICELVAINPMGLPRLCSKYSEIPHYDTIKAWRRSRPEFSSKYAEAKQFQAEILAESIEDVCDELDLCTFVDEHGNKRIDSGLVAQARLKVDSRKWTASKLAPKIYGDRKELEQVQTENADIKAELQALRAQLAEQNKREY